MMKQAKLNALDIWKNDVRINQSISAFPIVSS